MNSTFCANLICMQFSTSFPIPDAEHHAHSWSPSAKTTNVPDASSLKTSEMGHTAFHEDLAQAFRPPRLKLPGLNAMSFRHLRSRFMISFLSIWSSCPVTSQSTKVLNLVISSRISCRSTSVILCVRLGINVFASSALSQHRLAFVPGTVSPPPCLTNQIV